MANKKVTLVRLCKTGEGWRRLPAVIGRNGKVRPGYALLDGLPVAYPEGHYELRMYEGTRTIYKNVGDDAADALASQKRESHLMAAKDSARSAGVKIVETDTSRVSLQKKKGEFVQRQIARGKKRASETAELAIDGFLLATGHVYADQVTESSVLTFYKHLRQADNSDRTIYNKHVSLFSWFNWLKLDIKALAPEGPPSYTKKEVEIYEAEELGILLKSCKGSTRLVFEVLLMTGLRMQEAMHLQWTNVDFRNKEIRVREMLDSDKFDDVRIKDRAERSVPLRDDLAEKLKEWKAAHPKTVFVLGTKNDTPNGKWLVMLKRAARNAGLNCGRCAGCRGTQECYHWTLKKFRATYTTNMLRGGLDARTVMSFTGHENLATVLLYLAPVKRRDVTTHARVNEIQWTA